MKMYSSEITFFALFGVGAVSYYIFIFKMYSYVKKLGLVSSFPFTTLDYFKFLRLCSKLHKELKDNRLKFYVYTTNTAFVFCVFILFYFFVF